VDKLRNKYKQLSGKESYDTVIIKLLKEVNQPLSVELISFLTGISKPRCCMTLKRLERKWDMIRKVTVKEAAYYTAI
jgi:DNA-binding transcriptional regulator GbsR (MarR family)